MLEELTIIILDNSSFPSEKQAIIDSIAIRRVL